MTKQTRQKLKSYTLLASIQGFSIATSAQVTYTDINPDTTLTPTAVNMGEYILDFNNDGTFEVAITAYIYGTAFNSVASLYALDSNAIRGDFLNPNSSDAYVDIINSGDSIKPSDSNWRSSFATPSPQHRLSGISSAYPNWMNQSDKFMAVRFDLGVVGQLHYGWVRMTQAGNTLIVKDYAYNTTPNQGLIAGEGILTSADEKYEVITPLVHVYDHALFVNLQGLPVTEDRLDIYNTSGQLVFSATVKETTMSISLSNFSTGIYFVQLLYNGEIISRKIYID
jgi:hypothetical protein